MIDAQAVRALIRTKVAKYKNLKEASSKMGISPRQLGQILRGHRSPGLVLLRQIGVRRVIGYEVV